MEEIRQKRYYLTNFAIIYHCTFCLHNFTILSVGLFHGCHELENFDLSSFLQLAPTVSVYFGKIANQR